MRLPLLPRRLVLPLLVLGAAAFTLLKLAKELCSTQTRSQPVVASRDAADTLYRVVDHRHLGSPMVNVHAGPSLASNVVQQLKPGAVVVSNHGVKHNVDDTFWVHVHVVVRQQAASSGGGSSDEGGPGGYVMLITKDGVRTLIHVDGGASSLGSAAAGTGPPAAAAETTAARAASRRAASRTKRNNSLSRMGLPMLPRRGGGGRKQRVNYTTHPDFFPGPNLPPFYEVLYSSKQGVGMAACKQACSNDAHCAGFTTTVTQPDHCWLYSRSSIDRIEGLEERCGVSWTQKTGTILVPVAVGRDGKLPPLVIASPPLPPGSEAANYSNMTCNGAGINSICTITHACVHPGGQLVTVNAPPGGAPWPERVVAATPQGLGVTQVADLLGYPITIRPRRSAEEESDLKKHVGGVGGGAGGTFLLWGLHGGENFGHHLGDSFFAAYQMMREARRRWPDKLNNGAAEAWHGILTSSCSDYPWQRKQKEPGMSWSPTSTLTNLGFKIGKWHIPNEKYTADCTRHLSVFKPAMRFTSLAAASAGGICVDRLVVGSAYNAFHNDESLFSSCTKDERGKRDRREEENRGRKMEEYRDYIIRSLGRDPNARPSRPQGILVVKSASRSKIYRNFTNEAALLDALRARVGGNNVRTWEITESVSFEEQIDVLLNTTVLVIPGGGVAFSSLFLAKGQELVIWPYAYERVIFKALKAFVRVRLWDPMPSFGPLEANPASTLCSGEGEWNSPRKAHGTLMCGQMQKALYPVQQMFPPATASAVAQQPAAVPPVAVPVVAATSPTSGGPGQNNDRGKSSARHRLGTLGAPLDAAAILKHFRFASDRYESAILALPPRDYQISLRKTGSIWPIVSGKIVNPRRSDGLEGGVWSVVEDARFRLPELSSSGTLLPYSCPASVHVHSSGRGGTGITTGEELNGGGAVRRMMQQRELDQLLHVTDTAQLPSADGFYGSGALPCDAFSLWGLPYTNSLPCVRPSRYKPHVSTVKLDPVRDADVLSVTHFTHDVDALIPRLPGPDPRTGGYGDDPPGKLCMRRDIERFLPCHPAYVECEVPIGISVSLYIYLYLSLYIYIYVSCVCRLGLAFV